MLTSPQRQYPSPARKTKSKSLWELAHQRIRTIRGVSVLGTATTGGPSKDAMHQPGTADCKGGSAAVKGAHEAAAEQVEGCSRGIAETLQQAGLGPYHDQPAAAGPFATASSSKAAAQQPGAADCQGRYAAVTGAPEAAAEQGEGCSRGHADALQQAAPGPDLARASAAGPQLEKSARGGNNVVISLTSSTHASEASEDDGTDDDISVGTYSNRGSPAAGASMQPPAASSAPAAKAATAARSGDSGDSVIAVGGPDEPGSAGHSGASLPQEQGSPEVRRCNL